MPQQTWKRTPFLIPASSSTSGNGLLVVRTAIGPERRGELVHLRLDNFQVDLDELRRPDLTTLDGELEMAAQDLPATTFRPWLDTKAHTPHEESDEESAATVWQMLQMDEDRFDLSARAVIENGRLAGESLLADLQWRRPRGIDRLEAPEVQAPEQEESIARATLRALPPGGVGAKLEARVEVRANARRSTRACRRD